MLSSVLNSDRAIEVNIQIMRTFSKIKELVLTHKNIKQKIEILERKYRNHDEQIQSVFRVIKQMIGHNEPKPKQRIGFQP